MKYCVVEYNPWEEYYEIIARFMHRKDAKLFAKTRKISIEEQVEIATKNHMAFCVPTYIFACREEDIEEYIDLFYDDAIEVIKLTY